MTRLPVALLVVLIPSALVAQSKVDPRALADCNRQFTAFTEITDCLPPADVGVRMLDFFVSDDGLGAEATPVVEACLERNSGQYEDAWSCTRNAFDAALELGAMLPEASEIADPLFAPLNRPDRKAAVDAALKDAKARFPQVSMWGLNMFKPLN